MFIKQGTVFLLLMAGILSVTSTDAQVKDVSDNLCTIPRVLTRTRPDPEGEPIRVKVGIFLVDLINVNEALESFEADFRLSFTWNDPRLSSTAIGGSLENCRFKLSDIWHPDIDLINQRTLIMEQDRDVDISPDGTVRLEERILGELLSPLDLRDFPFDTQKLKIQLASFEYGPEDVIFVVDTTRSGRFEEFSLPGWEILRHFSDTEVSPISSATGNHTRMYHTIIIARHANYYLWKLIVPLCLLALMAWSVYWLDPNDYGPQIGVATATVFSLVAFLLALRQGLPRVAYLTRLDELVFSITLMVFLTLGEVILTSWLAQGNRKELARKIDRYLRWIYLVVLAGVLCFTLFL